MITFKDEKKGRISATLFGVASGLYFIIFIMAVTRVGTHSSSYGSYNRYLSSMSSWSALFTTLIYAILFGALAYTLGKTKNANHLKIILIAHIAIQLLATILGVSGLGFGRTGIAVIIALIVVFASYGLLLLYCINSFAIGEDKPIPTVTYMVPLVIFCITGVIGVFGLLMSFSSGFYSIISSLITVAYSAGFIVFILATKPSSGTATVPQASRPTNNTIDNNKMETDADILAKLDSLKSNGTLTSEEFDKMKNRVISGADDSIKNDIKEIESIKKLLDNNTISTEEFQKMKEPFFGF